MRYTNNKSSRYNGKDYWESRSKIRRESGSKGNLSVGENVTVKTKSRVWKAVVVNVDDAPRPKKMSVLQISLVPKYRCKKAFS